MANHRTKLELTWIGKENRPRLEPRILIEDPGRSHHASFRAGDRDFFDNRLIFGDNLLALKALEQEFAGKIKCIFIDPPYNTGSAFTHYDDGVEHSIWLSMMRDRLDIIRRLLSMDGSLWITIDDNECHYLKVLCDEVFGRAQFVGNVVWQKKYTVANDAKWLSENHDHVLVYAINKDEWRPYRLKRTTAMDDRYRNPDSHPKGVWKSTPLYAKRTGSEKEQAFRFRFRNGVEWSPPRGSSPRFPAKKLRQLDANNEIWFGADGTATPSRKTFLEELSMGEDVKTFSSVRRIISVLHPASASRPPPNLPGTGSFSYMRLGKKAIPLALTSVVVGAPHSADIASDIAADLFSTQKWEPSFYLGLMRPLLYSALRGGIA